MNDKAPCLNCPDRTATCHSECERYKRFKEERDALNAQRNKERRGYQELCEYKKNKAKRCGKWQMK